MSNGIPIPNVIDRQRNFLTIGWRNDDSLLGYRLRVANSLDNAYGAFNGVAGTGTTALFDVARGRTFISPEIRRKKTGISGDITRGQTRATFDPGEFYGLSPEVPSDSALWFVRTQVTTLPTGGFPLGFPGGAFPGTFNAANQSSILIIGDPTFFSVPRPALSLYGTAPDIGAVPGLPAPPEALIIHVPAFADAMVLTNHGPGILFVAVGRYQPLMQVAAGAILSHTSGMKDEIVLAADGGNPAFSILISTVAGSR
jgi:hypothetical protein